MTEPETDLLTAQEVGVMLRVTDKTVRNWADDGLLPQIVLPAGTRRFRRSDVEALLASASDQSKEAS